MVIEFAVLTQKLFNIAKRIKENLWAFVNYPAMHSLGVSRGEHLWLWLLPLGKALKKKPLNM